MDEGFCENYNIAIGCPCCVQPVLWAIYYMLSQEFSHITSLPPHAHVSERAKATLRVPEASEATCIIIS